MIANENLDFNQTDKNSVDKQNFSSILGHLYFLIELSLTIDILLCVFLCCDVMLLFQKKGEGLDP